MNKNAKLWVKALRSGKFKQTKAALRRTTTIPGGDPAGFCCLGVACEVYRKATGDGVWKQATPPVSKNVIAFIIKNEEATARLPSKVRDWLGLQNSTGFYGYKGNVAIGEELTVKNDNGADFARIADIIESEPEGLFKKED